MKFDSQITFLYVKDLDRTSEFYEKIIGLEPALDQGNCRIYKSCSDSFIGFCRKDSADINEVNKNGVIITFVTENADEYFADLKNKNVEFTKELSYNKEYKIYNCFIKDPDGYLIEIQRFEDQRWYK